MGRKSGSIRRAEQRARHVQKLNETKAAEENQELATREDDIVVKEKVRELLKSDPDRLKLVKDYVVEVYDSIPGVNHNTKKVGSGRSAIKQNDYTATGDITDHITLIHQQTFDGDFGVGEDRNLWGKVKAFFGNLFTLKSFGMTKEWHASLPSNEKGIIGVCKNCIGLVNHLSGATTGQSEKATDRLQAFHDKLIQDAKVTPEMAANMVKAEQFRLNNKGFSSNIDFLPDIIETAQKEGLTKSEFERIDEAARLGTDVKEIDLPKGYTKKRYTDKVEHYHTRKELVALGEVPDIDTELEGNSVATKLIETRKQELVLLGIISADQINEPLNLKEFQEKYKDNPEINNFGDAIKVYKQELLDLGAITSPDAALDSNMLPKRYKQSDITYADVLKDDLKADKSDATKDQETSETLTPAAIYRATREEQMKGRGRR